MNRRLPILLRSAMYALRGGFLIRPLVIAILLGLIGAGLSATEEALPGIGAWVPQILFPSRQDPQVAQIILSDIATSIMTVVSIVFAIVLMTLTLASTQFSPRMLLSFVRDQTTQWTLGVFLGTFSYCVAALPAARSLPTVFTPVVTVTGAMLLALICVGWLIYFIHHISQSISVNHIVDRSRVRLNWSSMSSCPGGDLRWICLNRSLTTRPIMTCLSSAGSPAISASLMSIIWSLSHAPLGVRVRVERRVGHFVPEGVPILRVSKGERLTPEHAASLLAALDIGPTRTMQQDVEFGVIQIVDVALRALSPAVNDPSTAISCVDQLSRIVIQWLGRVPPLTYFYSPPHVLRVVLPWISFEGLVDTAFEQIRHYSCADAAVSLRLLRAFGDILDTVDAAQPRALLLQRARNVVAGCAEHLSQDDLARLRRRFIALEAKAKLPEGARPA